MAANAVLDTNRSHVAIKKQIIVAVGVTQEANDVQQLGPMLQTMVHTLEATGIEDPPKAGVAMRATAQGCQSCFMRKA